MSNLELISERYREHRMSRKEAELALIVSAGLHSVDAIEILNSIDRELRSISAPPLPAATIPYSALPTSYHLEEERTTCLCGLSTSRYRLYKEVVRNGVRSTFPMQRAELIYDHTPILSRVRENGTPVCPSCLNRVKIHHAPPPPPKPQAVLSSTHDVLSASTGSKPPKAAKPQPFDLSDLGLD